MVRELEKLRHQDKAKTSATYELYPVYNSGHDQITTCRATSHNISTVVSETESFQELHHLPTDHLNDYASMLHLKNYHNVE